MKYGNLDDVRSLSHTRWRCKYHIVFAPEVQESNHLWENQGRYREDIKRIMQKERSGYNCIRGMSGPYSYAGSHTAAYKCVAIYGIFEK